MHDYFQLSCFVHPVVAARHGANLKPVLSGLQVGVSYKSPVGTGINPFVIKSKKPVSVRNRGWSVVAECCKFNGK